MAAVTNRPPAESNAVVLIKPDYGDEVMPEVEDGSAPTATPADSTRFSAIVTFIAAIVVLLFVMLKSRG